MRDKFIETLSLAVKNNPNIILITGALGFGGLDNFKEKYIASKGSVGICSMSSCIWK